MNNPEGQLCPKCGQAKMSRKPGLYALPVDTLSGGASERTYSVIVWECPKCYYIELHGTGTAMPQPTAEAESVLEKVKATLGATAPARSPG